MIETCIVIGAGIAGLSTGCYAQMNGYHTQIFEMHTKPGGLCTAWTRQGYTIDGCIHHLAGCNPRSKMYGVWQELGVLPELELVFFDELTRVEGPDGEAFVVYTDLDRLEAHMKALSPQDAATIQRYIGAVRRFARFELFDMPLNGVWDTLKSLPYLPAIVKWAKVTLSEYAQRFQHPFLQRAFPTLQYDFEGIPMFIHLNFLAGCHTRGLGWPKGGSLALPQAMAERYADLGGEVHYRARVQEVLVERDRAVGVRLADGSAHRADVVISAADGRATIYDMLGGRYVNDEIAAYYAAAPERQEMSTHVALGVDRDVSGEPHALVYFFPQPVEILGQAHDRIDIEVFGPPLAPVGKGVIKVPLTGSYAFWQALRQEGQAYDAQKEQLAADVIAALEARFPGLREQVEMVDVSTPLTVERFTGNYHGLQAWSRPDMGPTSAFKGFTPTLPGLDRFYMAGQWAEAMLGLSTAAVSGRKLVQRMCRAHGKRFECTVR